MVAGPSPPPILASVEFWIDSRISVAASGTVSVLN
jgi:hypothetical protein